MTYFIHFQGQDVPIRAEDLSPDTKSILEEVTRFLNMEKHQVQKE